MKDFEVIVDKNELGGKKPSNVVTETVVSLNGGTAIENDIGMLMVEKEVKKYLFNVNQRNQEQAKKRVASIFSGNKNVDNRTLRIPETEFQNSLLKIIYQKKFKLDNVTIWIKKILANELKEDSVEIQQQMTFIMKGIESCLEAIESLENEMKVEYKENVVWTATNNQFDARYKVDILAGAEEKDGSIKVLNLVQVKSSTDNEKIENIVESHQEYLNALPQLIGMLNKKEAALLAEKETKEDVIDINRPSEDLKHKENQEQLVLLGLVFNQYANNLQDLKSINANDFFRFYKKEGGFLSPFTVMGILKNKNLLNEYRGKYFEENKEVEEGLTRTADQIEFSEAESIAFYKKNHLHTIIDSAKIVSIVMVGGKKISIKELKHPLHKE